MATIFDAPGYLEAKTELWNSNHPSDQWTQAEMLDAIQDAGMTLEQHYNQFGQTELADAGVSFDANIPFDAVAYIAAKTNLFNSTHDYQYDAAGMVAAIESAGMTPFEHYQQFGKQELADAGISFPADNAGNGNNGVTGTVEVDLGSLTAPTPLVDLIGNNVTDVNLNAQGLKAGGVQDMAVVSAEGATGVNSITSYYSTADLTVIEVQDLPSNYTIGMDHTIGSNGLYDAADMTVKFEQDFLTHSVTAQGYHYDFLDQAAVDAGEAPLLDFPLTSIDVSFADGSEATLTVDMEADDITTYDQLVDALNEAAAEQDLDIQFKEGNSFSDGDGRTGTSIVVQGTAGTEVDGGNFHLDTASGSGNLYWAQDDLGDQTVPVATDVELTKVGQGADGGGLEIGSAVATGNNLENGDSTLAGNGTVPGIEQFNVTVNGGKGESSSLAYLQSTANTLETVTITSDNDGAGSYADLYIGNSETGVDFDGAVNNAAALKDVATLDASGFHGDLTVHAGLTSEFVAKYDVDADFTAASGGTAGAGQVVDASTTANQQVSYTGGDGNDTIDVAVDGDGSGTVFSDLEQASHLVDGGVDLFVDGGAGDDIIDVSGGSNDTEINIANWTVNGGSGDDNITVGYGHNVINGGAGDDTINLNADGSGHDAAWGDTIVFEGNFGHDTVSGFATGAGTTATVFEVQEFDLNTYVLEDNATVQLTVGGKTISYTNHSGGDQGGAALATAIAGESTSGLTDGSVTYALSDAAGVLTVTQGGEEQNIGTSTLSGLDEQYSWGEQNVTLNADTVDNGVSNSDVTDLLDFSSYDIDGLLIGDQGNAGSDNSLIVGEELLALGGGLSNGDTYISLNEQADANGNFQGIYQVEMHTVTADSADNDAASIIGQLDLGGINAGALSAADFIIA